MVNLFLDFFFPRRSLLDIEGMWITPFELQALGVRPRRVDMAHLRARGVTALDCLVASGPYFSPLLRKAVRKFKYQRVHPMREDLGKLLGDTAMLLGAPADAVLCPVPLHWLRQFDRGFNQSWLLAEIVERRMHWPAQNLLKRVRWTGSQALRSRAERPHALDGAFALRRGITVPKHVVLVDDIATTGTTLDICARVLKAHGAERVDGLVLAHG